MPKIIQLEEEATGSKACIFPPRRASAYRVVGIPLLNSRRAKEVMTKAESLRVTQAGS